MVCVVIPTGLAKQLTGGITDIDVDGGNVRQLIKALGERYDGLGPALETGMAVAIDGVIIQEPLLETVAEDSEVYFLPQIGGG